MKKIKTILLVGVYSFFSIGITAILGDMIFGVKMVNGVETMKDITVLFSLLFTIITSYFLYKKNPFNIENKEKLNSSKSSNKIKKIDSEKQDEKFKKLNKNNNIYNGERKKGNSLLEFPNNYVVFDLETTGRVSYSDEIIEIAALKILNGKVVEEFNQLVKPSSSINNMITKLTGITNSMVKDQNNILVVGKEFDSFVGEHIVVAHNANFDVNFIYDNFKKYEIGIFNNDFVDTLRLARHLVKDSKNHKLQTLISYFDFDDIGSHRAMADTRNTYKLMLELKELYAKNPEAFLPKIKRFDTLNLNEIESENATDEIDEENPFFNLNVCFTGIMNNFTKQEIGQEIANLGGILQNNVTLKTDILILGDVQKQIDMYGSKSIKHKRAIELQDNGQEIKILEEKDLIELIND